MANDFYAEHLVTKQPSGADTAKKALAVLATIAVAAVSMLLILPPWSLAFAALAFYGGYYIISGLDAEYEYIFTNGDLDIDKIIGKRKRKRLITVDVTKITDFGRNEDAPDISGNVTTVLAADGSGQNMYYMDYVHPSAGDVRVIFSPSEKVIEGIKMFMPRQLRTKMK